MNNLTSKMWATLSALIVPPSKKNDNGAGLVEYAAIILIVAAIAVAIYQLGIPSLISDSISTSVDDVLTGP